MRIVGVNEYTLEKYGAVSPQTVTEMASGAEKISGADYTLAISGVAGPDGGSEDKPVGLVYIGCCHNETVLVEENKFLGNRQKNRDSAVVRALTLLWKQINK